MRTVVTRSGNSGCPLYDTTKTRGFRKRRIEIKQRRIPESLDTMPHRATNCLVVRSSASPAMCLRRHQIVGIQLAMGEPGMMSEARATYAHAEGTAEVTEGYPGAGIACVVHGGTSMKYSGGLRCRYCACWDGALTGV